MMSARDYVLGGLVLLLLAAASPFIYEQAVSEPVRVDEAYWAERGYPPLSREFPPLSREFPPLSREFPPLPQNSLPPVAEEDGEDNF